MNNLAEGMYGTGCLLDPTDNRDLIADQILMGSDEVDWEKGYDIEKELNITIPFKDQGATGSCNGQGWAYYVAILNAVETGTYTEASAKAIYSQIFIDTPAGGSYVRDGAKLIVNWGALLEKKVPSYETFITQDINGPRTITNPPTKEFIRDLLWKTPEMDKLAKILQAKEYRRIIASTNMELFAKAIRDNHGAVSGLNGENNGTWRSLEPKPPINVKWGHLIYFGKYGIDKLGKYIATPNSWGERDADELHPDSWQKLRQDYFDSGHMFNPWTLMDKINNNQEVMTNVKVGKDENSDEMSFIQPVRSEKAFKSYCANYGIVVPLKPNGDVDWDKVKVEVSYKNKQ